MEKQCILNELYLLDKGVRDCFSETVINTEDLDYIIGEAVNHNYYVYTRKLKDSCDNTEFYIVYVCKYNYQKIMLHMMSTEFDDNFIVKNFIEGTILGYSGRSMEEFLMKEIVNKNIVRSEKKKDDELDSPV